MADIIISPVTKPVSIMFGDNATLIAAQAARATDAASQAEGILQQIQAFSGGAPGSDEVQNVFGDAVGLKVNIAGGKLARVGASAPVAFSGSVTLDAPATKTVTDVPYTLTYVNGRANWPFLTAKLPDGNLTNLVVKDATSKAVLRRGTDYVGDLRFGALGLAASGSARNVLVSYTASQERYDLIYVDPEYLSVGVVKGLPATRDASERIPNFGTKMSGQTLIDMRMPLFNARVTANGVDLVKLWNLRDGVAREFETQILADRRRNRDAIRPFLTILEGGADTVVSAMGDSITAIQSDVPSRTVPNGQYRDVATASGTPNTYLREGIIGTDLIDAVPHAFDNGDAAGATHTRFGRSWSLVRAAMERFAGKATYRNYSIAGTSSDDASLGMTNPERLAAWANDGADLHIIATGMNDIEAVLGSPGLFFNRVRQMIDAAYAGGSKGVVVWGCTRPQIGAVDDAIWLQVNRILRRAAMTPGVNGRTAAFIDLTLIYYGYGAGTMGVAPADLCMANGYNHPGIRQHEIEGEFGRRLILSESSASDAAPGAWINFPAAGAGWTNNATYPPAYRINHQRLEFRGFATGGSNGQTVWTLPPPFRPPVLHNVTGGFGAQIAIAPSGTIQMGSGTVLGLDGVSIPLT